jgi:hypothetical protein
MSFVYLNTQFLRGTFTLCMCPSSRVDLPHRESSAGSLGNCFFIHVFLTFFAVQRVEFLCKCAVLMAFEISCPFLASEVEPSRILSPYINTFLIVLLSLFFMLFVFVLFCPVPFIPSPNSSPLFSLFSFSPSP